LKRLNARQRSAAKKLTLNFQQRLFTRNRFVIVIAVTFPLPFRMKSVKIERLRGGGEGVTGNTFGVRLER
jgi:hypothetical protein